MKNVGLKLNVGCGRHRLDGFINIDADKRNQPDHLSDARMLLRDFGKDIAAEIRCYHMLEHLSRDDAQAFVRSCHVVLLPGGRIYFETPDFEGVLREYLDAPKPRSLILKQRIFGMQLTSHDFHVWGYSYFDLKEIFENAGFKRVSRCIAHSPSHEGPCVGAEGFKCQ